jgi:hypothetical protein
MNPSEYYKLTPEQRAKFDSARELAKQQEKKKENEEIARTTKWQKALGAAKQDLNNTSFGLLRKVDDKTGKHMKIGEHIDKYEKSMPHLSKVTDILSDLAPMGAYGVVGKGAMGTVKALKGGKKAYAAARLGTDAIYGAGKAWQHNTEHPEEGHENVGKAAAKSAAIGALIRGVPKALHAAAGRMNPKGVDAAESKIKALEKEVAPGGKFAKQGIYGTKQSVEKGLDYGNNRFVNAMKEATAESPELRAKHARIADSLRNNDGPSTKFQDLIMGTKSPNKGRLIDPKRQELISIHEQLASRPRIKVGNATRETNSAAIRSLSPSGIIKSLANKAANAFNKSAPKFKPLEKYKRLTNPEIFTKELNSANAGIISRAKMGDKLARLNSLTTSRNYKGDENAKA